MTCAALSGEVTSDVTDVLLQPFLTHKYENLKAILIERRGLTTPEKVNKVISGEKLGSDIPSRFLRRLQKTAGFGTKAVVGKAVIRQAFMPPSVHAHLATQPDSASLENLAMLADRAVAAEKDVDEAKPGVAEINVSESGKLVGLLEDLSRRLKKLETATAKTTKKKTYGRSQADENRAVKTQLVPNVQAKPFIPNNQAFTRQDVSNNNKKDSHPQPTDTVIAQVCYYHQTFGEKARLCSEPCSYYKTIGQREVANIASNPSPLLNVTDKHNKCNYLIDTEAAVSVLPKSCANRTSDAACLPLVATNNTTINTYGNCRRVVDVGLKQDYAWTFIVADVKQPIVGADFLIHYSLLVDLKSRCLRDMRTGLAIPATTKGEPVKQWYNTQNSDKRPLSIRALTTFST